MSPLVLVPSQGVGAARFGMTPAQVRAALEEPEVYEEWMGGNLNDSLLFRGLICGFDRCDARGPLADSTLDELRISVPHRGDATLWGRSLAQWTASEWRKYAELANVAVDAGPGTTMSSRALGMACDFDSDGRMAAIELWRVQQPSRPAV